MDRSTTSMITLNREATTTSDLPTIQYYLSLFISSSINIPSSSINIPRLLAWHIQDLFIIVTMRPQHCLGFTASSSNSDRWENIVILIACFTLFHNWVRIIYVDYVSRCHPRGHEGIRLAMWLAAKSPLTNIPFWWFTWLQATSREHDDPHLVIKSQSQPACSQRMTRRLMSPTQQRSRSSKCQPQLQLQQSSPTMPRVPKDLPADPWCISLSSKPPPLPVGHKEFCEPV